MNGATRMTPRRHWTAVAFGLCLGSLFCPNPAVAQCTCSPFEQRASGVHHIKFEGSPFYWSFWIQSAGMWTGTFEGTNVEVIMGEGSGQWTVRVDPTLSGGPWAQTYDGIIRINPDALLESPQFIEWLISHELGEMLGYGHSNCADSVMKSIQPSDVNNNTPVFPGAPERCTVEEYYLAPPTRRDDDGDGFSPDDEIGSLWWDCDDTNAGIGSNCESECADESCTPIIIPLSPEGIWLSDAAAGVYFDIAGRGTADLVAWPVDSDAAWLALDRNGNGSIDDGSELFGNSARLRSGIFAGHGFELLAELDENGDAVIDRHDPAFQHLKLWRDQVRDGVCDAQELMTLQSAGIISIGIDAKEARHRDRWGNEFRYRALVSAQDAPVARYVYDVILQVIRR